MKNIIKRALPFLLLCSALSFALHIRASAYDISGDMDKLRQYIPSDVAEMLPDEMLTGEELPDASIVFTVASSSLANALTPALSCFVSLTGIIIITSIIAVTRKTLLNGSVAYVFDIASALCVTLCLYGLLSELWELCFTTLESLRLFMNALLPVMTALYASGGEIASATASNAGMTAMLALIENVIGYGLYPLLKVCFGLSLACCIGGLELSGVSGFIRTLYTASLTFVMGVLTFVLAAQSKLAQSADSMTVRTIRFAAGSFIPVVGSAVSEAVRTVLGSFSYIKTTVGTIGVIIILCIVLPAVVKTFAAKIAFSAAAAMASLLGCDRESALISEMSRLMNMTLAALISMGVMFVFSVTLFVRSGLAQ